MFLKICVAIFWWNGDISYFFFLFVCRGTLTMLHVARKSYLKHVHICFVWICINFFLSTYDVLVTQSCNFTHPGNLDIWPAGSDQGLNMYYLILSSLSSCETGFIIYILEAWSPSTE